MNELTTTNAVAWGYVRVSSAEQFEHVSSIAAQCETIIRFADYKRLDLGPPKTVTLTAHDGNVVEIHARERIVFEAVSAYRTPFLKRPVAAEMFHRIKPGDHLIFPKMDRAFANVEDLLPMVRRFLSSKILFYFLDMGDFSYQDSAATEFYVTILSAVSRMERRRKGERHKEAHEARRMQGRRRCHIPCYQEIEVNGVRERKYLTRERDLQKQVYHWYNAGHTPEKIAAHLKQMGAIIHSLSPGHVARFGDLANVGIVQRMIAAEINIRAIAKEMGKTIDDELVLTAYRDRWSRMRGHDARRFGFTHGGKRRQIPKKHALPLVE